MTLPFFAFAIGAMLVYAGMKNLSVADALQGKAPPKDPQKPSDDLSLLTGGANPITALAGADTAGNIAGQAIAAGCKDGIGTFEGRQFALGIIPQLKYARSHGYTGPFTSGYRSHATNVANGRTYHSEHEETACGRGAVDVGDPDSAGALANRNAFLKSLKGYPGKTLQPPNGFKDNGHTSMNGH